MEIFRELKKELFWIGGVQLDPSNGTQYRSLRLLCLTIATSLSLCFSSIWTFLFDNHTPAKHAESVYFSLMSILLLSWIFIFLWKENDYLHFIDEINGIMKLSMFYFGVFVYQYLNK